MDTFGGVIGGKIFGISEQRGGCLPRLRLPSLREFSVKKPAALVAWVQGWVAFPTGYQCLSQSHMAGGENEMPTPEPSQTAFLLNPQGERYAQSGRDLEAGFREATTDQEEKVASH